MIILLTATSLSAADTEQLAFFENDIRPLLIERCIECHGLKKAESGLRLDTISTVLQGGDSGPAVVPGAPEDSLIIKAIRHEDDLQMPPDEKLDDRQVAALARWIQEGAVWPEGMMLGGTGLKVRGGPITDKERAFWSFQPVADPPPPAIQPPQLQEGPINSDIDRFILAKLRDAKLNPMRPADKRVLIRRATFDLTGLPPTPEDIEAFLADDSPAAFAKVVDRLLEAKAYGERWGRHWLDVVRYSDTAGETADYPTPLSYKYRNWVINAFHADMPYDQFVREQIAGDILADRMIALASGGRESPDSVVRSASSGDSRPPHAEELLAQYKDMLTATGFIAISRRFGFDVENYHHLTIQDTIDTVGQAFLGLSLGCARCHDHKYDPLNTTDYYSWYGIFESTRYSFPGSEEKKRPYDSFPVLPPAEAERVKAEFDAQLAQLEAKVTELESGEKTAALETQLAEVRSKRDAMKKEGLYETVYAAIEKADPKNAFLQIRGEKLKPGDEVPRKNLEILGDDPLPAGAGSGRLEMADWLTREENPLLARVMVNRIWQHHFGRGLVGTENDFGARGEAPTHPELLDWLASRFKDSGYSMKAMHRLIMASAAYQRSSDYDAHAAEIDPDARLLWRFNRRRLSAEEIRDAMLLAGGNLDPTMGGEHPFPAVETWGYTQHAPYYGVYPTKRRSVYLMQQRLKRHPFLSLFDGADTNVSTARRELTTVPTQALYLMNDEFVHEQAAGLAKRLIGEPGDLNARIQAVYSISLGRQHGTAEFAEASDFLAAYREALAETDLPIDSRDLAAWAGFARTLLTCNEFLFVD
ncbi:MAG: PSD1 and planctomycete cytochrome C domain-containing protein [Planctomycetota bacterium]|nr:PSD1 and planctomycete cytochrome C domain-containing protein [Planctomycetota bacterium]